MTEQMQRMTWDDVAERSDGLSRGFGHAARALQAATIELGGELPEKLLEEMDAPETFWAAHSEYFSSLPPEHSALIMDRAEEISAQRIVEADIYVRKQIGRSALYGLLDAFGIGAENAQERRARIRLNESRISLGLPVLKGRQSRMS